MGIWTPIDWQMFLNGVIVKYLLFFSLSLIIVGFILKHRSEPFDKVEKQAKIPSPDELWKEQQTIKKQTFDTAEKIKSDITSRKKIIKENIINVNKLEERESSPNSIPASIPSPDELWLLQQKENREFDLPATISDRPVITDEQKTVESTVKLETEENNDSKFLLDGPYEIIEEETLVVESSKEVVPFELRELEALSISDKNQNITEELTEPLINPDTGISDRESMQTEDIEPPIESEFIEN